MHRYILASLLISNERFTMLCWLAEDPKAITQLKASQTSSKKSSAILKLLTTYLSALLDKCSSQMDVV